MALGSKIIIAPWLETTGEIAELQRRAEEFQRAGFRRCWTPQVFDLDALTAIAVIGPRVPELEFGTSVVPIVGRHPLVLADQTMTVQAATNGRLHLGIGLSHKPIVEKVYGMSYDAPALRMDEYLAALRPLLAGQIVDFAGDTVTARPPSALNVQDGRGVPLLVAAMGNRMLEIAGRVADGTITWMTGIETIRTHIVPVITEAAEKAQRPRPRIIAGLPICLTDDPEAARDRVQAQLQFYADIPAYKAMLRREGVDRPVDIGLFGSEEHVREQLSELETIGVSEYLARPIGTDAERASTLEFLATINGER